MLSHMSPDVVIRVLNENDAADLWRIRLEALQREPHAFSESVAEHREISIESIAARIVRTAGKFALGAFVNGELVGTLRFERSERVKSQHRASIHAVYVTDAYRGRGVARALLAEMLRTARAQKGIEQIELAVGAGQTAAKRLYEALGFEYYGREERALKIGEEYIGRDLMVLRLV